MVESNFTTEIEMPEGISASLETNTFKIKGEKGEITKNFVDPSINTKVEGNKIIFEIPKYTKKQKMLLGTYKAHIKNMFKGVTKGHEYKLKVCSGHFPMNISFNNNLFQIKNLFGEKIPRTLDVSKDVELVIDGDYITVTGIDKNLVSQTAASIEQLTRRSKFDRRIFQDGIYIVNKDGKEIK